MTGVHRYEGVRGLADRDEGRAMTRTTPFRTASLGKTFTAALVLSLHEEGALSVDDPVSDYLPDFPHGGAITLRMLLTHTSGVANYTHVSAWVDAASSGTPLTEREVVALCAATELDFPPGTAWNYSNTGYLVLGMIAEQLVGRSVPEELAARFFVPLGMSGTVPFVQAPPDLARGYERDGTAIEWDPAFVYPTDGGWVTTASDLMIWSRAFFGGALHSEATLALARQPEGGELLTSVAESFGLVSGGYALGFLAAEDDTLGTLYAGAGNGGGVRTFVGFLPERDLAFATFVDVGDGTVRSSRRSARRDRCSMRYARTRSDSRLVERCTDRPRVLERLSTWRPTSRYAPCMRTGPATTPLVLTMRSTLVALDPESGAHRWNLRLPMQVRRAFPVEGALLLVLAEPGTKGAIALVSSRAAW
jgi:CubicO group peptidase (beta-lactamase class C family)